MNKNVKIKKLLRNKKIQRGLHNRSILSLIAVAKINLLINVFLCNYSDSEFQTQHVLMTGHDQLLVMHFGRLGNR